MSVTQEYDLKQVTTWLEAMEQRGLFNNNTARLRATAIDQFSQILAEDEPKTVSYMLGQIETIAKRWTTKKNANPATADAYRSRARAAMDEFLKYQADPSSFKGPAKTSGPSVKRPSEEKSKRASPAENSESPSTPPGPMQMQPYRSYPLTNGDFLYKMPEKGIVVADVRRLMLHMLTLATDFDPIQHTTFFALARTEK